MQETLSLDEYVIPVPSVDTSLLGSTASFLDRLHHFNNMYNTELKVQKSGRWEQGSYAKFKALSKETIQPRLESSRTIRNIFRCDSYNHGQVFNRLSGLDIALKEIREEGVKFFQDDDNVGKEALAYIIDNLNASIKANPAIRVEITFGNPWFNKSRPGGELFSKPVYPKMDCDGNILGYETNPRPLEPCEKSDPSKWYINIAIPIKDVNLDIYDDKEKILYSSEFGDLLIAQTICLKDAVKANRKIASNGGHVNFSINSMFSGVTYQFKSHSRLEHPFISRDRSGDGDQTVRRQAHQYGTGNTCFGGYEDALLSGLASGVLNPCIPLLQRWASYYPKYNVNPLNRYHMSMFGKPWAVGKHEWTVEPSNCESQVSMYPEELSKLGFIDTFCSDCQLIDSCTVYSKWTEEPVVFEPQTEEEETEWDLFIFKTWETYQQHLTCIADTSEEWESSLKRKYISIALMARNGKIHDVFQAFNVNNRGRGFKSNEEYEAISEAYTNNASNFTISDFIEFFYYCEEIYYKHKRDEMENVDSEDIITLRIHHIARQRMAHTPESEIGTFANRI